MDSYRKSPYKNRNIQLILVIGSILGISGSILWVLTTFLVYGLGGSNADLGKILGISTMLSLGFTFLASYLADRFRKDLILVIVVILQAIGVYLLATANTLTWVFIGQLFYASGASGLYPILMSVFSMSIPTSQKNRVFGTNFLIQNFFSAAGSILGYFALKDTNIDRIESIRVDILQEIMMYAFFLLVIVTVLSVLINDKYTLDEAEENEGVAKSTSEILIHPQDPFYYRIINPRYFEPETGKIIILSLVASYFIGFGAGISIPYLPRFFFDIYRIDLANINLLFAGMTIITALWGKISANLADKYGRNELIAIMQIVCVILLVVLASVPPLIFAFLALIVRNAAMNGTGPLFSAIQMDYTPRRYRSQVNAINSVSWGGLFAIGQIIGGTLVDDIGFTQPFLLTATFYFLATIPFIKIRALEQKVAQFRLGRR
ncbi:MAG: MFS transporter [Candidatus Heimdallarchaeota archaeon]|nr:MFS transporter [Candidatus Heimdallarchaeota archaeon]